MPTADELYLKLVTAKAKEILASYRMELAIFQLGELARELAKKRVR